MLPISLADFYLESDLLKAPKTLKIIHQIEHKDFFSITPKACNFFLNYKIDIFMFVTAIVPLLLNSVLVFHI